MSKRTENKQHYVDNKMFLNALVDYQKQIKKAEKAGEERPIVPEYIGDCFIKIANHLAYKSNFINYSFRDEMILDAIENCLTYMHNFNPKKSSNPFAYFTQITYYAFVRRIQKEKRHLQTKYRYIQSLDMDSVIRQIHDEGNYDNNLLRYLQQQTDLANAETDTDQKPTKSKLTRKPKYFDKDESYLDESEHIEKVDDIIELDY